MSIASQPNRSQPINHPDGEIKPPALTDIFDEGRAHPGLSEPAIGPR